MAGPLAASKSLPAPLNDSIQEARKRWLEAAEIERLLQQCPTALHCDRPPLQPTGGLLFLVDRRLCRHFRQDGHDWEKKSDGNVKENHMKLKVDGVDRLNCYYSYKVQDDEPVPLTRRSYWLLGDEEDGLVLVHYLRSAKKGRQEGCWGVRQGASSARGARRRKSSSSDEAAAPRKRARAEATQTTPAAEARLSPPQPPPQQEQRRQQRRRQQAQYAVQLPPPPPPTQQAPEQQEEGPAQGEAAQQDEESPMLLEVALPWSSGNLAAAAAVCLMAGDPECSSSQCTTASAWREDCAESRRKLERTLGLSWSLPDPELPSALPAASEHTAQSSSSSMSDALGGQDSSHAASTAESSRVEAPGTPTSACGEWMEEWLASMALGGGSEAVPDSGDLLGGLPASLYAGDYPADFAMGELAFELIRSKPREGRYLWQHAMRLVKAVDFSPDFWFLGAVV